MHVLLPPTGFFIPFWLKVFSNQRFGQFVAKMAIFPAIWPTFPFLIF